MPKIIIAFLALIGVAALLFFAYHDVHAAEYVEAQDGTATITLTADDVKSCDTHGGCSLLTNDKFKEIKATINALVKMNVECKSKNSKLPPTPM